MSSVSVLFYHQSVWISKCVFWHSPFEVVCMLSASFWYPFLTFKIVNISFLCIHLYVQHTRTGIAHINEWCFCPNKSPIQCECKLLNVWWSVYLFAKCCKYVHTQLSMVFLCFPWSPRYTSWHRLWHASYTSCRMTLQTAMHKIESS